MEAVVLFKNKYTIKTYSQPQGGFDLYHLGSWKSLSAPSHEMNSLSLIKGLGKPI